VQLCGTTQLTLTLGALFRQDVTTVGLTTLDGAGTGYLEPFGGASICLDLWHYL
jgi:hypothetical protein